MTNTKNTKRALLSSVLALFLCFAMLLGTTWAWFTDSVTSANNIIKSGTLNVEMYYADGSKTVPADNSTDWKNAQGVAIYTANQLWEPGYTDAKHIKISNEGSLALKYQLAIIPTGTVSELAEVIDVYLYEIANTDANATQVATRDDIDATMKVGTLADVISKGIVQGNLAADTDYTTTIVLKMQEGAGNEYQDKSIGGDFTIQLLATQYTAESDSFDNQYDEDAWMNGMWVYSAAQLNAAIAEVEDGGTIILADDITFDEDSCANSGGSWYEGLYYVGDKSFTLNLNGNKVTNDSAVNDYLMLFKNDGSKENVINIENGTLEASSSAYCAICTSTASTQKITINLENVTLVGNNSNGSVAKIRGGAELNVKAGTVITGNDSYLGIESYNGIVNIYDGAEIYQKGSSSYNGSLVGVGGNGTVNVYGGHGEGASGGFIAMTSGGTINVYGGEWMANSNGAYANGNKSVLIAQSDKTTYGGGNSVINVLGGVFAGGFNCYGNAVGDAQINISAGTFNTDPSAYVADGYHALQAGGTYFVVPNGISNVVTSLAELQAALDAATGDTTIIMAADITGNVNVFQKEGVNITIDGQNYNYDGTIYLNGNSRHTGAETLDIKNIDFVTDKALDFISCDNGGDSVIRYAHNVTIEDCTFTNNGTGTVVPARFRQCYDITMKNCTVNGTFSVMWATGGTGLKVDNVTADCTNEGIHVGTSDDVLIENCNITVEGATGYGVRADANGAYTMNINNCEFVAANDIVLRNAVKEYAAYLDGKRIVYNAESLQYVLDNATDGTSIYFLNDITGNVTVTQKNGVKITIDGNGKMFNGVMTVFGNGRKATAALTIKNINFVAANGATSCIVSPDRSVNNAYSYSSNVTVEKCTFTDPDGVVNCAAVRHEDGGDSNWKIVDCVVDNTMHSLIQTNNVELDGLTIQGCRVYSKNGINLNQCAKVSIIGCTIDVKGYAVRYGVNGATVNGNFEIKDSNLKSANDDGDAVIIFRGTMSGSTLTLTNTTLVGTPEFAGNANIVIN